MIGWTFITLIGTIFAAFCYRIGGMSKESAAKYFPWFPSFLVASWFRDFNCSLLVLIWLRLFLPPVAWGWYLLSFATMYMAMTTYFDDKLPPKGVDKFWAHGLGIRLALLFVAIPAGVGFQCLLSAIVLAVFMGVWCWIFSNDFVEEFFRGGIIILTLPILLI